MTFMLENWYLFIAAIAVATVIGVVIGRFLNMPASTQIEKCKEWMLWAVTQAEAELGSGTGQLKLRAVYDLFVQRFPAVAKSISFDTFMIWVDDALLEMREMLKQNKAVKEFVEGDVNG
ncbi:MAG: hypothetical protein IKT73_03480 [Anaerotignum sp.]|nr:hypothetical protein [Anaerotignum sp.]